MKTAELTGALLDYWVAKAEGRLSFRSTCPEDAGVYTYGRGGEIEYTEDLKHWSPSTEWEIGGPLMDSGLISTVYWPVDRQGAAGRWEAFFRADGESYFDESRLVAAMRAYVASKFGEDVAQ